MIFIAKNEEGIPSWKLIQQNQKTVTRRLKPMPVGKDFAICPGRGKFAVCRAEVISCYNSKEYFNYYRTETKVEEYLENEAHREGFNSWRGLINWFKKRGINIDDLYRIEFKIL